ncbi:MAG: preprotein translocase subunit SecG [Devosiaceae bacterium]
METVLIVIHLLVVIALVAVVLLQRSEGGGLGIGGGGGGGGGNFMSTRSTANVLSRATGFLALGFFITSISLTVIAQTGGGGSSILDQIPDAQPTGADTTLLEQIGGETDAVVPDDETPAEPQIPTTQ